MGEKGFVGQVFGLPSEFLTEELILMDKENMFKDKLNSTLPRTPLPTESPTESFSYYNNIENNFLVPPFPAVPNVPEKTWAMASSNESILSPVLGNGRSLVPSPPIAPIGRNIDHYQVTNLNSQGQIRNFTPINPSNPPPSTMSGIMWGRQQAGGHFGNGGYDVTPGMAFGGPQIQNQGRSSGGIEMTAVGFGGGVKKERAGTGVFLPRRYHNTTPESRKKTGGSTTQPPPRVVQAQNKKFEKVIPQPQSQRHFTGGAQVSENERRNAALAQERKKYELMMTTSNAVAAAAAATSGGAEGMRVNNEIRLPQEWTY